MPKISRRRLQAGFTLLELMIVVAIITILTALGIGGIRELLPSFRTRKAANEFAAALEQARILAMLENRESRVSVTNWDSNPAVDLRTSYGAYEIAVGNRMMGSTIWDVLPYEGGSDTNQSEGQVDFSTSSAKPLPGVSIAEPEVTDVVFNARGWLANTEAELATTGYLEFVFVNKIAQERGVDDRWSVKVYRGGMVRVAADLAHTFNDNDTVGYDDASSLSSSSATGGSGS